MQIFELCVDSADDFEPPEFEFPLDELPDELFDVDELDVLVEVELELLFDELDEDELSLTGSLVFAFNCREFFDLNLGSFVVFIDRIQLYLSLQRILNE